MKDQLITFDTAKLAKEKGFDEKCSNYYTVKEGNITNEYDAIRPFLIYAQTQSLLQKWLREKHNLHIEVNVSDNQRSKQPFYYCDLFEINKVNYIKRIGDANYEQAYNYEDALEQGLQEGLKLIKAKSIQKIGRIERKKVTD